jgi:putative hydrolase of the HAD superfamily
MPPIRAVLFDYGLVLSGPPDPVAWRRMEIVLNATRADLHAAYWRYRDDYDLGVLNGVNFWRTVGVELAHPPTDEELAQLLQADVDLWTQPNQPMIDWAAALQSAHVSTGILSNMGDAMEAGITARFPWIASFSGRTFSHNLGIVKPDERIYRHAIACAGESAEAMLFIDDRIENIEAARAVGLQAIQYTSHEEFLRAFRYANFTELPLPADATMSSTP